MAGGGWLPWAPESVRELGLRLQEEKGGPVPAVMMPVLEDERGEHGDEQDSHCKPPEDVIDDLSKRGQGLHGPAFVLNVVTQGACGPQHTEVADHNAREAGGQHRELAVDGIPVAS